MEKWEIQLILSKIMLTRSSERIFNPMRYSGNMVDSNHGNGTQLNKGFNFSKNRRVNDQLLTLILSKKYDEKMYPI